ncbi:annexin 5 [Wolffia australiana]
MSTLIVPPGLLSAREDAISLHKAFKGLGCDKGKVIKILAHRDATQRAFIQREYKSMYGEDLEHRLRSELSGDLERAALLWIYGPAERDALIVRKALSGDAIHLHSAIEVICSRTSSQIQAFKQIYHAKFGVTLENDINLCMQGDLQKLVLAYVGKIRYEGPGTDHILVENDTKDLYKAGETRLGTDEAAFIRVFTERSSSHLAAVASLYERIYGSSLEKAVKSETSGMFEFALLTILRCAMNPAKYFAKELYKAMKGVGTDDSTLIRIVVSRTEIDMQYIKAEYQKEYGKSLSDAIRSETSGHYRDFLLSLVDPIH